MKLSKQDRHYSTQKTLSILENLTSDALRMLRGLNATRTPEPELICEAEKGLIRIRDSLSKMKRETLAISQAKQSLTEVLESIEALVIKWKPELSGPREYNAGSYILTCAIG